MEDKPKIELKKHTLPKVSKWYIYRIIFYVVLLSALSLLIYFQSKKHKQQIPEKAPVEEINNITIEP